MEKQNMIQVSMVHATIKMLYLSLSTQSHYHKDLFTSQTKLMITMLDMERTSILILHSKDTNKILIMSIVDIGSTKK